MAPQSSYDTELITYLVAAVPVPTAHHFATAIDDKGRPLDFSIGNDEKFYLIISNEKGVNELQNIGSRLGFGESRQFKLVLFHKHRMVASSWHLLSPVKIQILGMPMFLVQLRQRTWNSFPIRTFKHCSSRRQTNHRTSAERKSTISRRHVSRQLAFWSRGRLSV
ncbi:hypothetical protein BYT27DRAFT_6863307 [Phlegmacium glaucopus]|nr:hypothetical protein BYT27DRAFT_6863307 [Phlegmacium glaucopus]